MQSTAPGTAHLDLHVRLYMNAKRRKVVHPSTQAEIVTVTVLTSGTLERGAPRWWERCCCSEDRSTGYLRPTPAWDSWPTTAAHSPS